jgi:hypothetical protein
MTKLNNSANFTKYRQCRHENGCSKTASSHMNELPKALWIDIFCGFVIQFPSSFRNTFVTALASF